MTKENSQLKDRSINNSGTEIDHYLQSGSDPLKIFGEWRLLNDETETWADHTWEINSTWDDIFKLIGPALIGEANE
ncbi:hypothetical protein [Croceicoccus hydrothermalis]|uniref:hypothetical protein n=1 Tax=Croceicoccus hydrothermalis TaxID=2867964 RepID=UPI001EFB157C|nr:hypothetical protein [Croceicoccus hydrothermalis]